MWPTTSIEMTVRVNTMTNLQEQGACSNTLPHVPRWQWETVVNFEKASQTRWAAAGKAIPQLKTILCWERITCWPIVEEEAGLVCQTGACMSESWVWDLKQCRRGERRNRKICWKPKIWSYFFSFHYTDRRQIFHMEANSPLGNTTDMQSRRADTSVPDGLSVLTWLISPAFTVWQMTHVVRIIYLRKHSQIIISHIERIKERLVLLSLPHCEISEACLVMFY